MLSPSPETPRMERTRIIHYTNSRTPVVISPTSPCVDEKAPLASADPDTPRRASKSCERGGSRSSSASRLFDDSKLRTCVYTAVRCQDYPSDRIRLREHKDAFGNERPHSASLVNGKSPNIDSEENRRHTLGSWSRSRRKSKNESPNSSFSNTESSSPLPKRADKDESFSSKTLVKSRRRYTWLSPKPPAFPEAALTLPLRERNTNYDENDSPTSSRSSTILPSSLEPNAKTPSPTSAGYPRRTASLDTAASSRVDQKAEPVSLDNSSDSPLSNATLAGSASTSSTPADDSRPQSDAIHWKKDPRRRPFSHFQDAFDLSPPHSPPQTPSQSDIGTKRPPFHGKGSVNSDTGYSSSSTSDTFHYATLPSPNAKAKLSLETRSASFNTHDLNFRNRNTYNNSPNLSIRNGLPSSNARAKLSLETRSQSFNTHDLNSRNRTTSSNSPYLPNRNGPVYNNEEYIYEDTTPVNEEDDKVYPQGVQASNSRQYHPASPYSGVGEFHDRGTSVPPQGPPKARQQVQRSQSQKINTGNRPLLDPTKFTKNRTTSSQRIQTNCQNPRGDRDRLNSSTSKAQSSEYRSNDVATVDRSFMSPRTRNSFRMAMGNIDTWCDINLSTDSVDRFLSNSSGKTIDDFPNHGNVSPKVEADWRDNSLEDDIFVNWDGPVPSGGVGHDDKSNNTLTKLSDSRDPGTESDGIKTGMDEDHDTLSQYYNVDMSKDDSLTRRIKRNSMRLATASLTDLTCAVDDIDIGEGTPSSRDSKEKTLVEDNVTPPLAPRKTHLSRTGSLLSSLGGSSVGSYYSCQSTGGASDKNSPLSNARLRDELRARLDSPGMQRMNKNFSNSVTSEPVSWDSTFPRVSSSRRSTPASTPSIGRSSHRHRPVYYWTRQSPYPRLLTASSSASSSKASSERCPSSPQPSISSSIHSNHSSNSHNNRRNTAPPRKEKDHSENLKSMLKFSNDYNQEPRLVFRREDPAAHRQDPAPPPPGVSARPNTLPIPLSQYSPSPSSYTDQFESYTAYASDLTPTSLADSPNSDAVMSPPSLGRPRRKQYAGFDCQPLPMDSFMSDSSSVYTGVSCSSRATDMTGQPDNASQFDESFFSEDVRSNYEMDDSRGDISFEASGSFKSPYEVHDVSQDVEESQSKHGSVHSSSTTKLGNGSSSMDNIDNDNNTSSHHETSFDDFIDNSSHQDCISPKYSQFGKHFGPEYDAIFRLYKSDDVIGQHDLINPPSYPLWLKTGKALSSSCLLRSRLYSKHKFMSTRDIFDLMRSPNTKTPLDGTVSLTSLEQHAHRVCEAILRCDEINKETHSLV